VRFATASTWTHCARAGRRRPVDDDLRPRPTKAGRRRAAGRRVDRAPPQAQDALGVAAGRGIAAAVDERPRNGGSGFATGGGMNSLSRFCGGSAAATDGWSVVSSARVTTLTATTTMAPVVTVAEIDLGVVLALGNQVLPYRRREAEGLAMTPPAGAWASDGGQGRLGVRVHAASRRERSPPLRTANGRPAAPIQTRRAALRPSRSKAKGACRFGTDASNASCRGAPQGGFRRSHDKS